MRRRDLLRGALALLTCATPAGLLEGAHLDDLREEWERQMREASWPQRHYIGIGIDYRLGPDAAVVVEMEVRDGVWTQVSEGRDNP